MEWEVPQSRLVSIVTGLKRSIYLLQYFLENLQEKDLNFTRKGTSPQINFKNIP